MAYLMAALVIVPGSFDELDWDSPSVSTCLKQFTKTSPWVHFCFVQIPPNYRNTIINADCLAAAGKLPLATGPPAIGKEVGCSGSRPHRGHARPTRKTSVGTGVSAMTVQRIVAAHG
jgi:hypothetical protein